MGTALLPFRITMRMIFEKLHFSGGGGELCTYTGLDIYITDSSQEQHVRSFNKGIINTISQ